MSNTTILLGIHNQESNEDICLGSNIRKRLREYGYDSLGHDGTLGKLFRQGMFNVSKARKAGADKFLMDIFQKKVMNQKDNPSESENDEGNLEGIPLEAIISIVQNEQRRNDDRDRRNEERKEKEEDRKLERDRLASQVRTIHLNNMNPNLPPTGFGMINPMTLMAMASALQQIAPIVNQKTETKQKLKKIQGKELLSVLSKINQDKLNGFIPTNNYYAGLDSGTKILLQIGSRNEYVKDLQNRLIELGEKPGKPDGIFGKNTKQAVVNFQNKNDLKPDGIVGAKTLEKLFPKKAIILLNPEPIVSLTPIIPAKELEKPVLTQQETVPSVPTENIIIDIPLQSPPEPSTGGRSDDRVPTQDELAISRIIVMDTGLKEMKFHHSPKRMWGNARGFYDAKTGQLISTFEEMKLDEDIEKFNENEIEMYKDNNNQLNKSKNSLVTRIKRENNKVLKIVVASGIIFVIICIIRMYIKSKGK